jgi:hypothetical protein
VAAGFALRVFETACQRLARFPAFPLADYLTSPVPVTTPFALLRFDVDFRTEHALQMAQIAAQHQLCGSFYFRWTPRGFDFCVINAVASLGHEIGYHFETLDICRGNLDQAADLFIQHVEELRAAGLDIKTAAAHGAIPTAAGYKSNLDLLRKRPHLLERAHLAGETTLSVDFSQVTYVSDAGWRWHRYEHYVPGKQGKPTSLLTEAAQLEHNPTSLYFNFHPHQWFSRGTSARYYRLRNRMGRTLLPVVRRLLNRLRHAD